MKQNAGALGENTVASRVSETGRLFKWEFLLLLSQADGERCNRAGLICV